MPKQLTRSEKVKCKVIFALVVVSLLIEKVSEQTRATDDKSDNPAVHQCVLMIDELLANVSNDRKKLMMARIQLERVRFTKKVSHISFEAGLVGALSILTSGIFRTHRGTRLDFIIGTFKRNFEGMEHAPYNAEERRTFERHFRKAIIEL